MCNLAVAGYQALPPGTGGEAALMLLNPGLNPLVGQSRLFGDFGPNREFFNSLAEDPPGWPIAPGYILAGITYTPWFGPDPADLYLVHEDPAVFACESSWTPVRVGTSYPQVGLQPARRVPARQLLVPTAVGWQSTGQQICAP